MIFNKETSNKLTANYSIIEGIRTIIKESADHEKSGDKSDKYDTFREDTYPNNDNNLTKDISQTSEATRNDERTIKDNINFGLKMIEDTPKNTDGIPIEVSPMSPSLLNPAELETKILQNTRTKIEARLFTNPLISESYLLSDKDHDYNPNIINNTIRNENSDSWFCKKYRLKDDKWGMMRHSCKNKEISN